VFINFPSPAQTRRGQEEHQRPAARDGGRARAHAAQGEVGVKGRSVQGRDHLRKGDPVRQAPGEEFTNRCFDSILNRSSNELRNDFPAARPRSEKQNRCLESWYSSIVS
jgi:hypothetical protein